jgi:Starch synthase catalytic domain
MGMQCRRLDERMVTSATAALGGTLLSNFQQHAQQMSVVFVSAEVGPWSKTGGLGDVTGGAAHRDHA